MELNRLIGIVDEFPTLPTIYSQLLEIMANPHSTVMDVAKIIEQDQSSATKVLKAVNSSLYGLQVRVGSISKAIFHLGFNEVKNLVISLSMINLTSKMANYHNFSIVDFWKHSIGVGVISRALGSMSKAPNIEDYFISGIVHDIGKLVFINYFSQDYSKVIDIATIKSLPIRQVERDYFGFNSNVVGEMLADKWKLPDPIKKTIKYQHVGLVEGKANNLVGCVHLAVIISKLLNLGNSGDAIVPKPNPAIWSSLNLPSNSIINMLPKIMSDFHQSTSVLLLK